jgi:hypothetical protein
MVDISVYDDTDLIMPAIVSSDLKMSVGHIQAGPGAQPIERAKLAIL